MNWGEGKEVFVVSQSPPGKLHDVQTRCARVVYIAHQGLRQAARRNIGANPRLHVDFDLTFFLLAV
jgi:hypothetical protein